MCNSFQVGRDGLDVEEQCKDRLVLDAYATRLRSHGTKCGLKKLEIPARYKLTTDSWTPANGLVTAAFKIRRKAIQDRYRADIEQLFHT
ncbi:ACSL4 [Cordylochernes scorpioides]|uniref:ACSL4 n=1 Tax=Cordylochernes scorpioides TaxID=51811 RepID=A0ABY6KVD9_9ARAC|nr:ACSL4 [Cordylochernes scorpioides]